MLGLAVYSLSTTVSTLTNMKLFLSLLFVALMVPPSHAVDFVSDSLGPQINLIEDFRELSKKHDYAEIYRLLGSEYRSVVTEKRFVLRSQELAWKLKKLEYGAYYSSTNFAWMPVRGIVVFQDGQEHKFDTVAFFAKEAGQWRFITFPFLRASDLTPIGAIPAWILAADSFYGGK